MGSLRPPDTSADIDDVDVLGDPDQMEDSQACRVGGCKTFAVLIHLRKRMSITELVQSADFVAALMLLAGIFICSYEAPEAVKMLESLELWQEP